ncbi:hypothetical protein NQ315_015186 [Exocentrus adspersus]|uniref:YqaJ viral recombinase domain-containing protein n=1 Tax=Exocentrus adspersus TaxID=1586481 RepID=A0AAV8VI65_9CUCU|nr:hypothetical protein NQ315_015186 [Exocentrus adspersus]
MKKSSSNRNAFKQTLKDLDHNSGLLWLMTDEPNNSEVQILPFIEDIIMSENFINSENKNEYLQSILTVTKEQILEVFTKDHWPVPEYHVVDMEKAGFVLHPCGFIGASPDGFLSDGQGLVEVKCPYRLKDKNLKSIMNITTRFRGQLFCTERQYCYLVLWTTVDVEFIKILKNANWSSNIDVLKKFYFEHYIKYISK